MKANFTFDEGIQADTLILTARALLTEAEQVAAGLLVRITDYSNDGPPTSFLYPARVARYAYRALGNPAAFSEGYKLVFCSRGATVAVEPTLDGFCAFCRAMVAYGDARLRRSNRKIRQLEAKIRANEATMRRMEGGQQA